jgi:rod shape-determining protein MreD
MGLSRNALVAVVVLVAVTAQVAVFSLFSVNGVVPDLALIVVVAASISRGQQFGVVVGFVTGLLVDLAPPSDHIAGRWALSLVVVAILAGRVRGDARSNPLAGLATVAVCSFVGTSLFALSGLVLDDHALPVGQIVEVIGIGVLWDVVMAPLLLPLLLVVLERTRAPELAY